MKFLENLTAYPLSVLNDPFSRNAIVGLHIHCFKLAFMDRPDFKASVKFKNGNTEGEQHFQGNDFCDLMAQIQAFLQSLPDAP